MLKILILPKRSAKRMSTCVPVCIVVRRVTYISLSLSIHIICGRIPRANTQWRTTGGLKFPISNLYLRAGSCKHRLG